MTNALPVFLHIPSTGGVSLSTALRDAVPDQIEIRAQSDIETFVLSSSEERADITALCGHIPYGVHTYLDRKCAYVTVLREPIDRLIAEHARRMCARGLDPAEVPLVHLATRGQLRYADNNMVRRFANYPWPITDIHWSWRTPFGEVSDEMYRQAEANLRRCDFVGVFERYEDSARAMFMNLGHEPRPIPRLNTQDYDRSVITPDEEDRAMLLELNRYDTMLYQVATELFAEKLEDTKPL